VYVDSITLNFFALLFVKEMRKMRRTNDKKAQCKKNVMKAIQRRGGEKDFCPYGVALASCV
jgi:hypothetical protein